MESTPDATADSGPEDPPPERPFTLASLATAVTVCVVWWLLALTAYFAYAQGRSATTPASGCTSAPCPSERSALVMLGLFGLLPTAFVGMLVSLVVLVYAARSLRRPLLLGTVSALAGMVLGAAGFIMIATFEP